jgi:hypothetical protein
MNKYYILVKVKTERNFLAFCRCTFEFKANQETLIILKSLDPLRIKNPLLCLPRVEALCDICSKVIITQV